MLLLAPCSSPAPISPRAPGTPVSILAENPAFVGVCVLVGWLLCCRPLMRLPSANRNGRRRQIHAFFSRELLKLQHSTASLDAEGVAGAFFGYQSILSDDPVTKWDPIPPFALRNILPSCTVLHGVPHIRYDNDVIVSTVVIVVIVVMVCGRVSGPVPVRGRARDEKRHKALRKRYNRYIDA